MPVTFGSVGDIIALALLVKDLVDALERCRGSQAEYRKLVQELRLLEDVLRKVNHLCNTSGTSGASFETAALHQTALKITDSCRNLIQAFTGRLAKYDKALGDNTPKKNVIKSAIAKIRWQVGEKEDVVRFRAEVAAQTTSLSVLLGATTWGVGKDTQQLVGRLERRVSDCFDFQTTAWSNITAELTVTTTVVHQVRSISGSILGSISRVGDLCTQIKLAVAEIFFVNLATYKVVLALHNSLPSRLERSLINEPFILEDAIGRISPVHLQFISSWAAFDAVLETRFRGLPGYDKIVKGHWILQDHATGREILRKACWDGTFLPGQRVDMSLLFHRETTVNDFSSCSKYKTEDDSSSACPRCQADVSQSGDKDVQCDNCGLCFRRITEIHEAAPAPTPQRPKPWEKKPAFGKPSFQPTFGPHMPAKKRRHNTVDDFDVSSFKRIRIHSRLNKIKRHVFASQIHKPMAKATSGATFEPGQKFKAPLNVISPSDQDFEQLSDQDDTLRTKDFQAQTEKPKHTPLGDISPIMHLKYLPRGTVGPSILQWTTRHDTSERHQHASHQIQRAPSHESRDANPIASHGSAPRMPPKNDLAKCLLYHKTLANAENGLALHSAVTSSHEHCAKILLEGGTDVNKTYGGIGSLLCLALLRAQHNPRMLKLLLEYGADMNARNSAGDTALHFTAKDNLASSNAMQILLEHGADVSARNKHGLTALHCVAACWWDRSDAMRLLLEHGANVDSTDWKGNTALHFAVTRREPEPVRLLLHAGANPLALNSFKSTAFQLAVEYGTPDIVAALLDRGVLVDDTLLGLAEKRRALAMIKLLTEHKGKNACIASEPDPVLDQATGTQCTS